MNKVIIRAIFDRKKEATKTKAATIYLEIHTSVSNPTKWEKERAKDIWPFIKPFSASANSRHWRDYIDGHRMKTGEEFITPILPYTQKFLERNDYKLHITSNQKYNQFLKGVGLALGCSFPLTTHVARHTFACTISLGEGIPKEVLQVMMGHSSIRTTELYAKLPMEFVTCNLDKKLFHVWG